MNHHFQHYSDHLKKGVLSPPLPLVKFSAKKENETIKTLTGEEILSIPNNLEPSQKLPGVKLSDPMITKKLSKWFVARSQKEVNYRQMESYNKLFTGNPSDTSYPDFFEYTIYESLLHIENKSERSDRKSKLEDENTIFQNRTIKNYVDVNMDSSNHGIRSIASSASIHSENETELLENNLNERKFSGSKSPAYSYSPSLIFDAEFESGNLEKAVRVIGRETLASSKTFELVSDYEIPQEVDQEYDLTLRNDLNTDGNIQWYYFSVSTSTDKQYSFPLKVRFNIINMQKKDSLYNYGMKPAFFSKAKSVDWTHAGDDICYFKNGLTTFKERKKKVVAQNMYTLTFTYTFHEHDTIFFAHSYPYTYSDLSRYLNKLENSPTCSSILFRRTLCETLAGNKCEILTITERADGSIESRSKPSILITGRVHPGETNSSYIIQGIIDFLCSDSLEASKLRKVFIFSIVPMMNPDGVIHGNYRCSLAGTDLNRRFSDAHPSLHPTIVALKDLIQNIKKNRPILLYLDIHGHSKQKNSFLYGCDLTFQPEKYLSQVNESMTEDEINKQRILCRIFPKILCSISKSLSSNGYFSYKDCAFSIDKTKFGTGRVVCWKDFSILGSYTIEASFCSNGDNSEKRLLKKYFDQLSNFPSSQNLSNYPPTNSNNSNVYSIKSPRLSNFSRRPETAPQQRSNISTSKAFTNIIGLNLDKEGDEEVEDLDIPDENDDANSDIMDEVQDQNISDDEKIDDLIEESFKKKIQSLQLNSSGKRPTIPEKKSSSSCKRDLDIDPALSEIISNYKNTYHYQKSDLLNMGKHIALAIFHFSNLTHSDLEYEKEIMLQTQLEKVKRNAIFQNSSESSSKFHDMEISNKSGNKPPRSTLASILVSNLKTQSTTTQNGFQSNLPSGSLGLSLNLPPIEINDPEGCVDDFYSDGTPHSTISLNDIISSRSNNDITNRYRPITAFVQPPRVESIEETMTNRLLLKPSVFTIPAIQSLLQSYGSEVLIEKSSLNLGLRIKSELAIRHLLKLDEKIKYEKYNINFDSLHNSWIEQSDEDESAGGGSESDPSVDNKQASNFLKNMKKYKDSNALVNALRSIAKKKRAKELELQDKKEKKLLKKLALENELALKLKAEQDALEKNKKDKQDKNPLSDKPLRPSRPQSASNYRPRRQSIYNSVPKHTPVYKLAPSNDVKINIPVQIKIVNFKDFDKNRNHRHQHSQLFSHFLNDPNMIKNSNIGSSPVFSSGSRPSTASAIDGENNIKRTAGLPPPISIPPNPLNQNHNIPMSNYDNIISLVSGNLSSPSSNPKFKKSIAKL